jgi:hypothetical protein
MIRLERRTPGKRRRPGGAVTHGWTPTPRHRDDTTAGPTAADGMEECARKWVAAMKLRAVENRQRQMARCN